MGKKHKKQLKELQRLQALHQDAAKTAGQQVSSSAGSGQSGLAGQQEDLVEHRVVEVSSSTPMSTTSSPSDSFESQTSVAQVVTSKHSHVKRDLVFLVGLIVIMIAGLIAINWAIDNTELGNWLVSLFQK